MGALTTANESDKKFRDSKTTDGEQPYKTELIWHLIVILNYFQIGGIYGLYLVFTSAKVATTLFAYFLYRISTVGVTAGVHRLWSHRTYKAKWPLRLLLMTMFTLAFQDSVIKWSKDHRVHHKYTDTDADPYSSKKGFFFSHMGWLFRYKHPDVIKKGKEIDFSDLYNDPIVKFQHDHYLLMALLISFIIPTLIPMYLWNETLNNAFYVAVALRWTVVLHTACLINSVAHMYGNKPFDKNSSAVEHLSASVLSAGEGWHNFHHAFPWDYKASELGRYCTNTTTAFIDFFAWVGWAYDLKTVSDDIVRKRVGRTGDGTHPVWGWNDQDVTEEDRKAAVLSAPK